jgi:4-hydroxy-tetrahydrodipicolinate synthase
MGKELHGIYAAVVTPFDTEGHPDHEQIESCLKHIARKGAHGVLLAGTTGEGPSLSVEERVILFRSAVNSAAGLKLLAGTGAVSLTDTIAITRLAFDAGIDAVVIIPPFFYRNASDDGLFAFYEEVLLRAVPGTGQVLLYHNPGVAGIGLSVDLVKRLVDAHPGRITGIKDSSNDLEHSIRLISEAPGLNVLVGDDRILHAALAAGGAGSITLVNNLFADLSRAVFDSVRAGRPADEAQTRLVQAYSQFEGFSSRIPAVKSILKAGRIITNDAVRPPLSALTMQEMAVLKSRFMLDIEVPSEVSLSDLIKLNQDR